ncbi:Molybdenum cofactor biosynthesis protein C, partial [Stegodyphus mimosarum]
MMEKLMSAQNRQSIRTAEAESTVYLGPKAFELLQQNEIRKDDVLSVAIIAGIMAAKKTSELIPLC